MMEKLKKIFEKKPVKPTKEAIIHKTGSVKTSYDVKIIRLEKDKEQLERKAEMLLNVSDIDGFNKITSDIDKLDVKINQFRNIRDRAEASIDRIETREATREAITTIKNINDWEKEVSEDPENLFEALTELKNSDDQYSNLDNTLGYILGENETVDSENVQKIRERIIAKVEAKKEVNSLME